MCHAAIQLVSQHMTCLFEKAARLESKTERRLDDLTTQRLDTGLALIFTIDILTIPCCHFHWNCSGRFVVAAAIPISHLNRGFGETELTAPKPT